MLETCARHAYTYIHAQVSMEVQLEALRAAMQQMDNCLLDRPPITMVGVVSAETSLAARFCTF